MVTPPEVDHQPPWTGQERPHHGCYHLPGVIYQVPNRVRGIDLGIAVGEYGHPCVVLPGPPRGDGLAEILLVSVTAQTLVEKDTRIDTRVDHLIRWKRSAAELAHGCQAAISCNPSLALS